MFLNVLPRFRLIEVLTLRSDDLDGITVLIVPWASVRG